MNKEKFLQSDVALYGMFICICLVFGYIESLIPYVFPVPGIKLGLANIVILWVMYSMGVRQAAIVSVARILIGGFLFGNFYSIMFSLVGGIISLTAMYLARRFTKLSITGVSIVGGVFHNLGQTIVAVIVLSNLHMFFYFPFLLAGGIVSGIAVGILGSILYNKIKLLQTNVHL